MPKIIDGRAASSAMIERLSKTVAAMAKAPKLVVVQIGENAASSAYIRQKQKAAEKCGIDFELRKFSDEVSCQEIKNIVTGLNEESSVDSFIVQLPMETREELSKKDEEDILELISPRKDADGMHTYNQGKLFCNQSEIKNRNWSFPISATALGVLRLLEHYDINLLGADITLLGKSRLVGMPAATLLSHAGATVQICHRLTKETAAKCREADIVVVAVGRMHMVKEDFVHEESVLIDVGIHRMDNGKLTGDVDPKAHSQVAAYSPVPGGVGPMTVAALMENAVLLAQQKQRA